MRKNYLKLVTVFCLCLLFVNTPVQAASDRPVLPSKMEVLVNTTQQFPISLNGWTIINTQVIGRSSSVASVEVKDNAFYVEGYNKGKGRVIVILRAAKGKTMQTFRYRIPLVIKTK